MRRLCTALLALAAAAGLSPAADGPALPGVVRREGRAWLIENHSTAYLIWHALGLTNATLVHLDAHDDCRFVPPAKLAALDRLAAERRYDDIFRQSDIGFVLRFQSRPENALFDLGNFIYPCLADGTVGSFYWVVPNRTLDRPTTDLLQAHLQRVLRMDRPSFTNAPAGGFAFAHLGRTVTVTTLDGLPALPPGALLDIDADFFALSRAFAEEHVPGALEHDPRGACARLHARVPQPAAVTVSESVWGGYLPVLFGSVADGCFDFFTRGRYPDDAERLLAAATRMRAQVSAVPLPPPPADPAFEPAYLHLQGITFLMTGRDADALDRIEQAARQRNLYAKSLLDAAEAGLNMGKPRLAQDAIGRFEALQHGRTVDSVAARIRAAMAERQLAVADRLSGELLDWSRDTQALLLRGGVLVAAGRPADAVGLYREVLATNPANAAAHYNLGCVQEAAGDRGGAEQEYRLALQLRPAFAMASENLGFLLLQRGDLSGAAEHLAAAVRLNPSKIAALNNLGLALGGLRRRAEAIACFRRAIALNPDVPETRVNLGDALAADGDPRGAAEQYREALKRRPEWKETEAALRKIEGAPDASGGKAKR